MNFLQGRIEGRYFVFSDQRLLIPEERMDVLGRYEGKNVTLGARAEMISIADAPSESTLEGTYYSGEYLGSNYEFFYKVGDVLVEVFSLSPAEKDKEIHHLSFDMSKVHFFDQETTARIK